THPTSLSRTARILHGAANRRHQKCAADDIERQSEPPRVAYGGKPGRGMSGPPFSRTLLAIDAAATAEKIEASIRRTVLQLRRRGVVVALSGGIDRSGGGAPG